MNTVAVLACTLLLAAVWPAGARGAGETAPAACAASKPGVAELEFRDALDKDADAVDTRIRLANALSDRGCYADAVKLLEAGVEHDPDSRLLKERLRSARSTQGEQGYFEGLGDAQEAARAQRDLLRCRELADLAACDQALARTPGDHDLLVSRGDALMRASRPAEALMAFDKAVAIQPADDGLKAKMSSAESARLALVNRCLGETGDAALAACDQGLRHGARDEFSIYQRKGALLQAVDQPSRALDAYIAAGMLEPRDRAAALAIVALTDSTGRQDAAALTARGAALLAVGRSNESVAVVSSNAPPTTVRPRHKTPAVREAAGREPAVARYPAGAMASSSSFSNNEPAGESH